MQSTKPAKRKRVNFMVEVHLLEDLQALVSSGERSNFVNEALEESLIRFSREKAVKESAKLRKKFSIKMSEAKLKKELRYGLE